MALTRARVLVGSDAARQQVGDVVTSILRGERDGDALRDDALKMRTEMAAHKQARGSLDAKLLRGGLVDIEFLVHLLQLRHREALTPHLDEAISQLIETGRLPGAIAEAHSLMTRLLVGTRLLAPDLEKPKSAAAALLARQSGCEDYDELIQRLHEARRDVAAAWRNIYGETLEIDE